MTAEWDRIIIRPLCFFPPQLEFLLNHDLFTLPQATEMAKEFAETGATVDRRAMQAHFKQRINIVNKLVEAKKLDPGLGKIAVRHFESHLRELESLPMEQV